MLRPLALAGIALAWLAPAAVAQPAEGGPAPAPPAADAPTPAAAPAPPQPAQAPAPAPAPAPAQVEQPGPVPATTGQPSAPTFPTVPDAGAEHPSAAGPIAGAQPYEADALPPPPYQPYDWGIGIVFGFAFGGDELVNATRSDASEASLSAGDGVQFALVGSYSPLHLGDGQWLSMGIDLELGVKMSGLNGDNGTLDFGRFPLIPRAHAHAHLGGGWHLSASAGVQYDMGVFLSGDGVFSDIDAHLGNGLGPLGELGVFYQDAKDRGGYTFALRYVHMEYDSADTVGPIDASSIGFALTALFLL